jgi:hypothetical protein
MSGTAGTTRNQRTSSFTVRRVAAPAIAAALLLTACGAGETADPETEASDAAQDDAATASNASTEEATDEPDDAEATPADGGEDDAIAASLEAAGFGQSGDYLWITSVVRNEAPTGGQFVTVSFNLLDEGGNLLATESQVESFNAPGQRLAVGTQVDAPTNGTVASVEATLLVDEGMEPEFPDVTLEAGEVTLRPDEFGGMTASATLTNPSQETLPGARVGVICTDAAGTIIGGGSAYPDPAGGQIVAEVDVIVSGEPASCEMLANPGI